MKDRHKPRAFRVPIGGQVTVPGKEPGVDVFKESAREGDISSGFFFLFLLLCALIIATAACGVLEDALSGDSMHRRLTQSGSMHPSRGIRGDRVTVPASRAREVAREWSVGVEDDVRDLAGSPLGIQESFKLFGGAAGIEVGETYSDKGAIPAPLVRIEVGGGFGPAAKVVAPQNLRRSPGDVGELVEICRSDRRDHRTSRAR